MIILTMVATVVLTPILLKTLFKLERGNYYEDTM